MIDRTRFTSLYYCTICAPLDQQLANDFFAQAVVVTKSYKIRGNVIARLEKAFAKDFESLMARLDEINALADGSPGFVWRLQTTEGNATYFRPYPEDDRILLNMSVWESVEALKYYVYRTAHAELLRHRHDAPRSTDVRRSDVRRRPIAG